MAARHEAKKEELRQDDLEKHKWRLLKIKAQIEAPDYQQDQEMAAEARNSTNAGDWVSQSRTGSAMQPHDTVFSTSMGYRAQVRNSMWFCIYIAMRSLHY